MSTIQVVDTIGDIKMTKQEILNRLERIADSMDMDFLNRQEIEGIVKDIRDLTWKINVNMEDVYE